MSLLTTLFSGAGFETKALGFLKGHMLKDGIHTYAISVKPNAEGDDAFEIQAYKSPIAIITADDLKLYQDAVKKCLAHGI